MKKTLEILDALTDAHVEGTILVLVSPDLGLARRIGSLFAPLRAPHYTTTPSALVEEYALAAGGTFLLDEPEELSREQFARVARLIRGTEGNPGAPHVLLGVRDRELLGAVTERLRSASLGYRVVDLDSP